MRDMSVPCEAADILSAEFSRGRRRSRSRTPTLGGRTGDDVLLMTDDRLVGWLYEMLAETLCSAGFAAAVAAVVTGRQPS